MHNKSFGPQRQENYFSRKWLIFYVFVSMALGNFAFRKTLCCTHKHTKSLVGNTWREIWFYLNKKVREVSCLADPCPEVQERCRCLEFNPIVSRLNCFEKGHMRRKGSFDFHMPVIAKETTSLLFTYSACVQFWRSDKWHRATASSNKEGWRRLLDNFDVFEMPVQLL